MHVFQQLDSAPAHRARSTVEFLRHKTRDLISQDVGLIVVAEHSRPQPGRLQDLGLPTGARVQDTNTRLGRDEAAPGGGLG